jgi:hypothetical protein
VVFAGRQPPGASSRVRLSIHLQASGDVLWAGFSWDFADSEPCTDDEMRLQGWLSAIAERRRFKLLTDQ